MSRSQSAGQQLSVNDLPVVMEELNDIRVKWYNIGLQLRMSVGTLDAIKEQYNDPSHCLREALKTWLKTCPSHPTWNNIIDALRSSTVGEVRLAAELEQKYCSTQDASTHHHAPPLPSQPDTQTTPPQQSQSKALPVSMSQSLTQMTPPTQSTISPTQPVFASSYSVTPPPWSASHYYSQQTSYSLSTPLQLTPPPSGVATASVHPSYSQVPQVTPTSSRPLLPSVPAQLTTSQHLSVEFTSTSTSMISEKIQLLGKHPANTQDKTSSRKHQRISYTSDTPPVGWKPPTSSTAFPHILGMPLFGLK